MASSWEWEGPPITNRLVSQAGGARWVEQPIRRDDGTVHWKLISEAGLSTASESGTWPTAPAVHRAIAQWGSGRDFASSAAVICRVYGTLRAADRYHPDHEDEEPMDDDGGILCWRARRIPRWVIQDAMRRIFDPYAGSGQGDDDERQEWEHGNYPNTFIRNMADETGHDWIDVRTVQFYQSDSEEYV